MATKKTEKKLKYTKTWEKDFGKRYNKVMKELKSLEDEFKKMKDSNPNDQIVSLLPSSPARGINPISPANP